MKTYYAMSAFADFPEISVRWITDEISRCLLWLGLHAANDGIHPKWWEYDFEFHNLRWDIWITVEGRAHT